MSTQPLTLKFDIAVAKAVHDEILAALKRAQQAHPTISAHELIAYAAYSIGVQIECYGFQYDTNKGFQPLVDGYVNSAAGRKETKQ